MTTRATRAKAKLLGEMLDGLAAIQRRYDAATAASQSALAGVVLNDLDTAHANIARVAGQLLEALKSEGTL